jgi:hypothetical protein
MQERDITRRCTRILPRFSKTEITERSSMAQGAGRRKKGGRTRRDPMLSFSSMCICVAGSELNVDASWM